MIIALIIGTIAMTANLQATQIGPDKPAALPVSKSVDLDFGNAQACGLKVDALGHAFLIYNGKVYNFMDYIRPGILGMRKSAWEGYIRATKTPLLQPLGPNKGKPFPYAYLPTKAGNYLALISNDSEGKFEEFGGPTHSKEWLPIFSNKGKNKVCALYWFKAKTLPRTTPLPGDASFEEIFKDMDWSDRDSVGRLALSLRGNDSDTNPKTKVTHYWSPFSGSGHSNWVMLFARKARDAGDEGIRALCILCESSIGKINAYYESLLPMANDALKHESFWLQPELLKTPDSPGVGRIVDNNLKYLQPEGESAWANDMIHYATQMRYPKLSHVFLYAASGRGVKISKSQAIALLKIERTETNPEDFLVFMSYLYHTYPKLNVPGVPPKSELTNQALSNAPRTDKAYLFKDPVFRANCIDSWIDALQSEP